MVGIIQEQHPDRCRLFMQWKEMDWPVMVDSLDLLDVSAVPITILLDEHGIVRGVNPNTRSFETFLESTHEESSGPGLVETEVPDLSVLRSKVNFDVLASVRNYGDAAFLWGPDVDEPIRAYESAIQLDHGDARSHFRLGVAYRRRFESTNRQPDDFARAVAHWSRALTIDPNQYIYRRRIQQYGPRLDKPYSFYDWVETAREEIAARGDTPVKLLVEPSGAEFAQRSRDFVGSNVETTDPDPEGRITRDNGLIRSTVVVVPHTGAGSHVARVHVSFEPNANRKAHWNNESEAMRVWIDAADGWEVDQQSIIVPNASEATSTETRKIEFEIRAAQDSEVPAVIIHAFALYNVCEDVNGECLYRRLDLPIEIRFEE